MLVLLAVAACSKSDGTAPGATADPWAAPRPTPAAVAADNDPWAAPSAPAESGRTAAMSADDSPAAAPEAPPQERSGDASALAGSYQCQQLRYGTAVNGMRQSTYVSSALGVFEIDGDGTYRSASYPDKGTGRARASAISVAFEGGAYAGSVGATGTTSSGSFHIRFNENLTEAPAPNLRFNDHMCYRK